MIATSYLQCLCSEMEGLLKEYPNSLIWIEGDLNLSNINWNNNFMEGNSYPIPLCNILLEVLETFGFI